MMGVLIVAGAYLLGSIPTGLLLVRWLRGIDVRQYGSGATGIANVYRVAGPYVGAAVLLADLLKGAIPVGAARWSGLSPEWAVAAGLSAIAGHNWSVFLGMGGGKGTVTSLGVLVALSPGAAAVAAAVWLLVAATSRLVSLASVLAMLSVPFTMWLWGAPGAHVAFGVLIALLGLFRHRADLRHFLRLYGASVTDRVRTGPRR